MTIEATAELKARSLQIAKDWPGISPLMKELRTYWKENRPQMWRRLSKSGITVHFPRVLEQMVRDRVKELQSQRNPDAQIQARMEILGDMMAPEDTADDTPLMLQPLE